MPDLHFVSHHLHSQLSQILSTFHAQKLEASIQYSRLLQKNKIASPIMTPSLDVAYFITSHYGAMPQVPHQHLLVCRHRVHPRPHLPFPDRCHYPFHSLFSTPSVSSPASIPSPCLQQLNLFFPNYSVSSHSRKFTNSTDSSISS